MKVYGDPHFEFQIGVEKWLTRGQTKYFSEEKNGHIGPPNLGRGVLIGCFPRLAHFY